jgi:hypothetical protein
MNRTARVIHMDVPRALTTKIKPFDFDGASYLNDLGIYYSSIDINIEFWNFLFEKLESSVGIESHLFYPEVSIDSIQELNRIINNINQKLKIPLSPSGFIFDYYLVSSTAGLYELCDSFNGYDTIRDFIRDKLINTLKRDGTPDIISLGIDSSQSLGFAALFATALSELVSSKVKIGVGKHNYEDFSLNFRRDSLEKSNNLELIFDFIIYQEEYFGQELANLSTVIDRNSENLSQPLASETQQKLDKALIYKKLIEGSQYQLFWGLDPIKLVYSMPLSRNKCYWKKCTFCVQINKHISDRFYSESSEVEIACATVRVMYDLGVRYIIFNDEAATPKNVSDLCDFLEGEDIQDLKWTVRAIADPNFGDSLIERMANQGCREVLFGLETVLQSTAKQMGKVSDSASEEDLMTLLCKFGDRGIGIFLNLIYAFPTESDEDFLTSFNFYQRAKSILPSITIQLNKFSLFYGSKIFKSLDDYELKIIPEVVDLDLQLIFNYIDKFGRQFSDPPNQQYLYESLEMDVTELAMFDLNFLETFFHINYASFGFIYKCHTNQSLSRYILSRFC